jgi:hypothetical protein
MVAASVTFLAISVIWVLLRRASLDARKLVAFGLPYLVFAAAVGWE